MGSYIRIVHRGELFGEVLREAIEHKAHLYVNTEVNQAIISDVEIRDFKKINSGSFFRVGDLVNEDRAN